jgi:hypothetical protein
MGVARISEPLGSAPWLPQGTSFFQKNKISVFQRKNTHFLLSRRRRFCSSRKVGKLDRGGYGSTGQPSIHTAICPSPRSFRRQLVSFSGRRTGFHMGGGGLWFWTSTLCALLVPTNIEILNLNVISISLRHHFELTSISLCLDFDFTPIALRGNFDFTLISPRLLFELTSSSLRCHSDIISSSSLRVYLDVDSMSIRFHSISFDFKSMSFRCRFGFTSMSLLSTPSRRFSSSGRRGSTFFQIPEEPQTKTPSSRNKWSTIRRLKNKITNKQTNKRQIPRCWLLIMTAALLAAMTQLRLAAVPAFWPESAS